VKGVVLSPERRVELAELPVPEPGQDEVLVRSHFCGICGTDLHAADIEVFRPGVVMGHEFAGEIVALGPGVAGWSVGQRVTINPNGHVCGRCRFCRQGRYNLCRVATLENAGHTVAPHIARHLPCRRQPALCQLAIPLRPERVLALRQIEGVNDEATLPAVISGRLGPRAWIRTMGDVTQPRAGGVDSRDVERQCGLTSDSPRRLELGDDPRDLARLAPSDQLERLSIVERLDGLRKPDRDVLRLDHPCERRRSSDRRAVRRIRRPSSRYHIP